MNKKFYRVIIQLEEVTEHESDRPSMRAVRVYHRNILTVGDDPDPLVEYIHQIRCDEITQG